MVRVFAMIGAISACISVMAGAFGAHALSRRLSEQMLETFEVGARYQMYHALALLAVGWVASRAGGWLTATAGWAFIVGTVLFCGSLYALALSGWRWLGAITPVGGIAFILGWAALAAAVARHHW